MVTENWTKMNYLRYIIDNKLDNIWVAWCNPISVDGIRVGAYTPLYPEDGNVEMFERKCGKKGCDGTEVIPLDDRIRKIIYKRVCNGNVKGSACGGSKTIIYRWISAGDRTKLWFKNSDIVKYYGIRGRSFYGTLSIYNKEIVKKGASYVDERLIMAHTLGIDIDIKRGTICESVNREEMQKGLDILKEQLNGFVGKSYNLQTSGNGIYVFIHHKICIHDILNTMSKFNAWIRFMNDVLKKNGITRIKFDPINMPSRVFKTLGSLHQRYDLVCIPLEYDCNLELMNSEEFKLKNFTIDKFYDSNGKMKFYDRCDENDVSGLYKYLEEFTEQYGDLRAVRHEFKESVEAITGEEQEERDLERDFEKDLERYVGWKEFKIKIPGRVIYKKKLDGRIAVEMLGVRDEDKEKVMDIVLSEVV